MGWWQDLDECHLTHKYEGVCLSAMALDGNNGWFSIAIYICRGENKEIYIYIYGLIS